MNYEIARTPEMVREAALGDIRLEWWRSALEEIHRGRETRSHPALEAYARANGETPFSFPVIEALIEARRKDWEARPFETRLAFDDYIDATAGGVMRLALEACGASLTEYATDRLASQAAWVWGVVGLLRAEPVWRARGRDLLPAPDGKLSADVAGAYREMRMARPVSSSLFAATGYVTLVPGYLRALSRGDAHTPLFARQLKLIVASATGRV